MNDVSKLGDTVIAKSDQLNADDLIGGPITVTVTSVSRGNSEQPVVIGITGQRPYKPCKSMRRVLITAWGDDGRVWVGRLMTLYCDPDVMFGGVKVGGIRISHLSHIDSDLIVGMNIKKGNTRERVDLFARDPITWYVVVEGIDDEEGAFALTVECFDWNG